MSADPLALPMLEGGAIREQMMLLAHDLSALYRKERRRAEEAERAVHELQEACASMVSSLALLVDTRDATTGDHIERATRYAVILTERIAPSLLEDPAVRYGFLLHDIGKIGVPEVVLKKGEELTEGEQMLMRAHPAIGRRMLARMSFLAGAIPVVECHHERWDGLGYPNGFVETEIPLTARIFSLADAYDAMTHTRPYREAMSTEQAADEILKHAGTQFDPTLAEAFLELQRDGLVPA